MNRRVTQTVRGVLVLAPISVALLLVIVAMVETALVSIQPIIGAPLTVEVWRSVLTDDAVGRSATFTMAFAGISAIVSTCGAAVAYTVLRRVRSRWVWVVVLVPAVLPHVVAALVVGAWTGPGGVLDRVIGAQPIELYRDPLGLGVIAAYAWKETAFILLLLLAGAPRDLEHREEMARVSGLGRIAVARSVTVPALVQPALVGCIAVLVFAIGALEIPALLGPTFPQSLAGATVDATKLDVLAGQSTAAVIALGTAALAISIAIIAAAAGVLVQRVGRRGLRRDVLQWRAGGVA